MRGSLLLAAACALSVVAAPALSRTGMPELRGEVLTRLRATDAATNSLIGLAPLPQAKDAAAEYLADLFQDEGFIAVTRAWLDSSDSGDSDGVYREWTRHYETTISAGVELLDDDDLASMARLGSLRLLDGSDATCARLMTATRLNQLGELPAYTEAELTDYFRILKRAYVSALTNKKPRPPITEEQMARGAMWMLGNIPEAQRARQARLLSSNFPKTVTPEVCADMKVLFTAMGQVPGEDGAALRRSLHLSIVRAAFNVDPPRRTVSAEVSGASAKGVFEPGAVRLQYPPTASHSGVVGTMVIRVWVDAQGYAQRVKTARHDFTPTAVTLEDGTEVPSYELFEPTVIAFYQAGRFQRRFKDGKPFPYVAEIPMDWKLE